MRLAIFEAMNGGERDQRLRFIVDELDALGQIDGLKDALARFRKFGGRCVLGFQSIAQVSSTYGQGEAQTIVENCGNTLILRCSASEQGGTARFASRLIGEREIVRIHESRSTRPGTWQASKTRSEQHVTESAVLSSEIEQLPDMAEYLKLASSPRAGGGCKFLYPGDRRRVTRRRHSAVATGDPRPRGSLLLIKSGCRGRMRRITNVRFCIYSATQVNQTRLRCQGTT